MREGLERAPRLDSSLDAAPDESVTGGRFRLRRAGESVFVAVGAIALFAGLWILLYALSIHGNPVNSDGATVVLEGQSMANGQVALHGWALSLDSFWGVDAIFYAIAVAVAGVHAAYLHLIPALIAAIVAVVGALIARAGVRGIAGFAGAATVVALIGLPSHALALDVLQGPYHIGTALWCLIAFVGLRAGRFGLGWAVAVVFLAAGTLGDLQIVAFGTIPVLLAGLAASARGRRWSAGLPAASAAVASVVLALVVREIAKVIGTFTLIAPNPRAPWSAVFANISLLGNYFPKLLGAGTSGFGSNGAPYFTDFAHGVGLIAVIAGVLVAVAGLVVGVVRGKDDPDDRSARWRLEDPLAFAFFGGLVVFVELTTQPEPSYARYIAPPVIFGAILAGRLVTRLLSRLVARRNELPLSFPVAATTIFVLVVAVMAVGVGYEITTPVSRSEYQLVGTFLEKHHLLEGVGDYWSSSIVTVDTNDQVHVRAVTEAPDGKLVRYDRESTKVWYAGQHFYFVVFNPTLQFGNVNAFTAAATYGKPLHTWRVAGLIVLTWRHPFTVSTKGIS